MTCGIVLSLAAVCAAADERVEVRGYYQEDGSYVRQRAVDPIVSKSPQAFPALPAKLGDWKREIERFYEGKEASFRQAFLERASAPEGVVATSAGASTAFAWTAGGGVDAGAGS